MADYLLTVKVKLEGAFDHLDARARAKGWLDANLEDWEDRDVEVKLQELKRGEPPTKVAL